MITVRRLVVLGAVLVACSDSVAPKPPYVPNEFVMVETVLSKTTLTINDTMLFRYSVENLTNDSLTLTTPSGCQIQPELDIAKGAKWDRAPLSELTCRDFDFPTITVLAVGEKQTFSLILGRYEDAKRGQAPPLTYFLTTGTWDASMLVRANEIGGSARSAWVRFTVQ